jgi:hypothetical protein
MMVTSGNHHFRVASDRGRAKGILIHANRKTGEMVANDFIGYLACLLVFLTFYQKSMVALRVTALLSNIVFIAYAARMDLQPILLLHTLLLPINLVRLFALTWQRPYRPPQNRLVI